MATNDEVVAVLREQIAEARALHEDAKRENRAAREENARRHAEAMEQAAAASTRGLRDYFAGQALAGLVARVPVGDNDPTSLNELIAQGSYELADAILAERERSR